jgi:hypothetical protein
MIRVMIMVAKPTTPYTTIIWSYLLPPPKGTYCVMGGFLICDLMTNDPHHELSFYAAKANTRTKHTYLFRP